LRSSRARVGVTPLALCVCVVVLAAQTASAKWVRFALVVGFNESDDSALVPLRYADDDAVKHAQLLSLTTERTVLLTALDDESRRVFGAVDAKAPTRQNVLSALDSLHADMAAARARGDDPVLFFVYSGHGNYDQEGRGYVHLEDGRFTTRDLYFDVLGPTEGDHPHHVILVVDSCNAALLVNSRGSDRRKVTGTSLKLESYPKVGVILSASGVGEVHEWGRLLSGVFSHEVRSALMGAGDLNDDGQVTFAELAAFVASANAQIKNESYRIKPYIRPPLSSPNMAILSFNDARFPARLRVDAALSGRGHLLDHELLRLSDFNKSGSAGFWLGLPGSAGFMLVSGDREYVVPVGAKGDLTVASLSARSRSVLADRGADQYFAERLFAEPLSRESGDTWIAQSYADSLVVERFEPVPWYENEWAWGLTSVGAGALGAAIGLHVASEQGFADLEANRSELFSDEFDTRRTRYERFQTGAIAAYSVGGAALLGGILWFILEDDFRTTRYVPPLRVNVSPTGVDIEASF
jgi:hypothetical protein